jgi:hypothetical protein
MSAAAMAHSPLALAGTHAALDRAPARLDRQDLQAVRARTR